MKSFDVTFEEIVSTDNLLEAWLEFLRGKRGRTDVMAYERELMGNLLSLHYRLASKTYRHGGYEAFGVSDPKPRRIHKATVGDRIVHRAIYRKLYPHFERHFIYDSYACRIGKGVHRALDRFGAMALKVSRNHTRTAWVLKCDVKKFFAFIDHAVLTRLLERTVIDGRVIWLLNQVIGSFDSGSRGRGLPLGNLTSQLFANVYLNELDWFVKHELGVQYYIRYADDFVIMSHDRLYLESLLPVVRAYLMDCLLLNLHPDKVHIETVASGVDFLGWIHFPDHRVLRTSTKRRMLKAIEGGAGEEAAVSYRALLKHGNTQRLMRRLEFV